MSKRSASSWLVLMVFSTVVDSIMLYLLMTCMDAELFEVAKSTSASVPDVEYKSGPVMTMNLLEPTTFLIIFASTTT